MKGLQTGENGNRGDVARSISCFLELMFLRAGQLALLPDEREMVADQLISFLQSGDELVHRMPLAGRDVRRLLVYEMQRHRAAGTFAQVEFVALKVDLRVVEDTRSEQETIAMKLADLRAVEHGKLR